MVEKVLSIHVWQKNQNALIISLNNRRYTVNVRNEKIELPFHIIPEKDKEFLIALAHEAFLRCDK